MSYGALHIDFAQERFLAERMHKENGVTVHLVGKGEALVVYTYNPTSDATFFTERFESYAHLESYLNRRKTSHNTYEVVWWPDVKGCTQTSYFYAHFISEVFTRFTEIPESAIQSIALNPHS